MATTYYNLPTVNGSDTADFVNAINGLATATDAALRNVANDIPNIDTINSQIATINSEITNIKATLTTTTSTANNALNTAQTALSTAQNITAAWKASPLDILQDSAPNFITNPANLEAKLWGNIVTVKFAASNLPYGVRSEIGHIKAGYYPMSSLLIAVLQQQTEGSPWAFFTIDNTDGTIAINPTYSGAKPEITTTVSGMIAYPVDVTKL